MFLEYLFKDPQYFVFWITIMVFSICFHEFSHAFVAHLQGDDTAKEQGYFTLDPMVHMGKISLICLLSVGICWGLCPVNPNRMKHKYSNALVSFAGPASNLLLSLIFSIIYAILYVYANPDIVFIKNLLTFVQLFSIVNSILFIFNMIPIPPLDGSKILLYFIPKIEPFYNKIGSYGIFILFLVLVICKPLSDLMAHIAGIITVLFSLIATILIYIFNYLVNHLIALF